jgi:aspartate/methionine/tyrosine aminotransferase
VDAEPAFVTTSMGGEAYAQWVRRAISLARSSGGDVVPLFDSSVEEPTELLREVVENGFQAPITGKYQSVFVSGNPYVLDALASRYGFSSDRILTTTGATTGLSLIYRTFLQPGDRILVETPGFDLFGDIGRSLGVGVDHFRRDGEDFSIDEFELAARLTPHTKLIVLSDLHNPSGMLLKPDVIARIARMAARRGVRLIVDEVYGDYAPRTARPGSAAHLSPNVIAVNSLTKIFGLSTLRCGWIIASPENIAPIRQVSDHLEFGVSKLAHAVAALVLGETQRFEDYSSSVLRLARPVIERNLAEWQRAGLVAGRLPDFGCIFFPRLLGIQDTLGFSSWLADRCGVIVAPGDFFGAPGHVRIGFAHAPDLLEFGLSRFFEGLQEYSRIKLHSQAARA